MEDALAQRLSALRREAPLSEAAGNHSMHMDSATIAPTVAR